MKVDAIVHESHVQKGIVSNTELTGPKALGPNEFPPKFFHGSLVMGSKTFANFVSFTRLAYLHLRLPMSTFMKLFNYWLRVNLTYPFSIPDDSASNAIPWDRFPLPVHPSGNEAPEVWPKVWMQNVPTLQSQSDLSIFILLRWKQKGILCFMI